MRITKAQAQDLAAELHAMSEREADKGYYGDANDISNTANELDRVIAGTPAGADVEVPMEARYVAEDLGLV